MSLAKFDNPALEYAAQIAYSSREVLNFTYEKAKEYADKPGVYVECGVAAGAQIIAMAVAAPDKPIYAFDSFEGIPLPSNKDDQMPGIAFLNHAEREALPNPGEQVLKTTGATYVSMENFYIHLAAAFKNNLIKDDSFYPLPPFYDAGPGTRNIGAIPGWFENTIPEWSDQFTKICILRLDGDLYNSTYVCLKHLYPKVIKGGCVIVDDYGLLGCREAVHDYFEGKLPKMEFIKGKDYCVAWWVK